MDDDYIGSPDHERELADTHEMDGEDDNRDYHREKTRAQILNLNLRLAQLETAQADTNHTIDSWKYVGGKYEVYDKKIVELKAKLKETIRAVEKLAKGKSLGTLGLPTEESWQKSTS